MDSNFLMTTKKIKTISNFSYMIYKCHLNLPMQMIEGRLNMNITENPQLKNSLNRGNYHALVRKYIHMPIND